MSVSNLYEQITWAEYKTNLSNHNAQTLFIKDKNLYCIKTNNGYVITNPQYTYCPFTYSSMNASTASSFAMGMYLFSNKELYFYDGAEEWTHLNKKTGSGSLITFGNKHEIRYNGYKLTETDALDFRSGFQIYRQKDATVIENAGVLGVGYDASDNKLKIINNNSTSFIQLNSSDTWRPIYLESNELLDDEVNYISSPLIFAAGEGITLTSEHGFGDIQGEVIKISASSGGTTTDNDTWRPICVNGTEILSSQETIELDLRSGNGITIEADEDGLVTFNTSYASSTGIGGIKLVSDNKQTVAANNPSTAANRTYALQLNSNNCAVVNVPWTDSNVRQNYVTNDAYYPLLGSASNITTSTATLGTVNKFANIYANKTGLLVSNKLYIGDLQGAIEDRDLNFDPSNMFSGELYADTIYESHTALSSKYMNINAVSYDDQTNILTVKGHEIELSASGEGSYILPVASSTVLGGVKLYSDIQQETIPVDPGQSGVSGRVYAIQNSDDAKLVVSVPWTDKKVEQKVISEPANVGYPVLLSGHDIITNRDWTDYTYKTNKICATPGGKLSAVEFAENGLLLSNKYMAKDGVSYDSNTSTLTINGTSYQLSASGGTTTDTNTWRPIYVGSVMQLDNTTNTPICFQVGQGISLTNPASINDDKKNFKFELQEATQGRLGGIKLGSNTVQTVAANDVSAVENRTYAIQKDSDGRAVVNVPWQSAIRTDVNASDMFDFIANRTYDNSYIRIMSSNVIPAPLLGVPLYIVSDDQLSSTFYYGERTYDFDLNSDTYEPQSYCKYELRIYPDSVLIRTIIYNVIVITDINGQEHRITTIYSIQNLDVTGAELVNDNGFNCTIYFAE